MIYIYYMHFYLLNKNGIWCGYVNFKTNFKANLNFSET